MPTSSSIVLVKEWKSEVVSESSKVVAFDIHRNRGGRGLMPENTIAACIESIKRGTDTLHLDVLVSGDKELVVANDSTLSASIYENADGTCKLDNNANCNIFEMNYAEIRSLNFGKKRQYNLPDKHLMTVNIPLLSHLIDRVEKFVLWNRQQPIKYNIDIKSSVDGDRVFNPNPETFALLVFDMLRQKAVLRRTIIQSSDVRVLKVFRKIDETIKLSYSTQEISWEIENDTLQNVKPDFFSPDYRVVNRSVIESLHSRHIKILPKVVNEILDINEMKQIGADGVLTDYPDRAIKVLN